MGAGVPIVDAFVRHVLHAVGDDDRLLGTADDADRELLVGVERSISCQMRSRSSREAVRDHSSFRRRGAGPRAGRRLAGLALGLDVLPPHRPLQLDLLRRRQLVGAGVGVGMPFSSLLHTAIMVSPANTRLRNTSRWDGRVNTLDAESSQVSWISSRRRSARCPRRRSRSRSPAAAVGQRRRPVGPRSVRPISSNSALASSGSNSAQVDWYSSRNSGLASCTVLFDGTARPKNSTWLISSRSMPRDSAAEAHVAEQGAPGRVGDIEVGEQGGASPWPCPTTGSRSPRGFGLAQERVVGHEQAARLQVVSPAPALAGISLVGDGHDDAVEVGQLPAVLVNAVEVGVALEREALAGRPRRVGRGCSDGRAGCPSCTCCRARCAATPSCAGATS